MFDAVIKVGGSLTRGADLRRAAVAWAGLAVRHRLLLVPGGGPFADGVRAADAALGLSADAAHWMAILAMDQVAYLLADLAPGAVLVGDLATAADTAAAGQLAILAPSALLLRLDPLPHGWHVTSDSIAAWLAAYTGTPRLVLLKSVAGAYQTRETGNKGELLPQVDGASLAGYDLVDSYFTQLLSPALDCWIIDGRRPERLAALLDEGWTLGTQIVSQGSYITAAQPGALLHAQPRLDR